MPNKEKILASSLAALSLASAAIYGPPSKACTNNPECATWLVELFESPEKATAILTVSGILSVIGLQAYFGFASVETLFRYMKKTDKKTRLAILIMLILLVQNSQVVFNSLGTNGSILTTLLSALGNVPSDLYTSVSLLQRDLPYGYALLDNRLKTLWYYIKTLRKSASSEDETKYLNCINIKSLNVNIQLRIKDRVNQLKKSILQLNKKKTEETSRLLSDENNQTIIRKGSSCDPYHFLTRTTSLILTMLLVLPILLNTQQLLATKLYLPITILLTPLLSLSFAYSCGRVLNSGCCFLFAMIKNIINKKSIPSLTYQLYPKTLIAAAVINAFISAFSFALFRTLFINSYDFSFAKKVLLNSVTCVICVLHYIGLMNLTDIFIGMLVPNNIRELFTQIEDLEKQSWYWTQAEEGREDMSNLLSISGSFNSDENSTVSNHVETATVQTQRFTCCASITKFLPCIGFFRHDRNPVRLLEAFSTPQPA